MKKNSLLDMHDILMEQLQRLNEAETEQEIAVETEKAKSMSGIARVIIDNSRTLLDAQKAAYDQGVEIPKGTVFQIEGGK